MKSESLQQTTESVASSLKAVPVAVTGISLYGVTLQEWVYILTGILLLVQIPTAIYKLFKMFKNRRSKDV